MQFEHKNSSLHGEKNIEKMVTGEGKEEGGMTKEGDETITEEQRDTGKGYKR